MSSSVLELLQNCIYHSKGDNELLKEYLGSCLELGTFHSKNNVELIVKTIHSSLNSSFDKEKGLILLLAFLPQISVDAYTSNAISWMIQCNKLISQKGETIDDLSLKVLSKLIQFSVKFPEINRETAKEIIPKLLLEQVKRRSSSQQISIELLECLRVCLSEYSGPSGEFRTDVLRLLLSVAEAPPPVVEAAACCIPLVSQVGGGGKLGVSHKSGWRSLQLGLVSLLHSLLNRIYQHLDCLTEVETSPPQDPALVLESVHQKDVLVKTQRLVRQFGSVSHYLQAMLLQEFPVAKSVAPDAILDVISHAQKPTHSTLGLSREALAVTSVLPSIQIAALNLLEALIVCVGRNLVTRAGLVNHLCCQVLVWSHKQHQDWPYAMVKPYSETRVSAYACLQTWATVAGAASGTETIMAKVLPVFLSDIHAKRPTVRLQVGSKTSKGKKKQQLLVNVEDRSEKLGDTAANHNLCDKALLALAQLVESVGPYIEADILKSIQDTVLTVSVELPVPYGASACLNSLYKLLLSLCLAPHPRVPPPLAHTLALFNAGVHNPDPQVKATCLSALSSLEKIIHPSAPTLNFAPLQDARKSLVQERTEEEMMPSGLEDAESPAKRRRVEAVDTASVESIVLGDSDDDSSIKSLKVEIADEEIGNISDDLEGTVDIISSDESRSSDKTEITENIPNVNLVKETKHPAGGLNDVTTSSLSELEQRIPTVESGSADTIKEHSGKLETTESNVISIPTETLTTVAVPETLDTDVSEMLMDFNDEVNNDN